MKNTYNRFDFIVFVEVWYFNTMFVFDENYRRFIKTNIFSNIEYDIF